MATVGSLGGITFNVSSRRVLTFDNYSRQVVSFILGNNPVSQNKWMITGLSEKPSYWKRRGKMHVATVSITLKEYRVDTNTIAETDASTPWGSIAAQVAEVKEKVSSYEQEALDVLDTVEDTVGDIL